MSAPPPAFVELAAMARAYQRSRALAVAAELGIADLLADGERGVDALAAATGTHAPTLYRLLRALASVHVLFEDANRQFRLTAMGEHLCSDHPLSVEPVVKMFCSDHEWQAWGELMHGVRTGENAAVHALGVDVWEHRRQHADASDVFDAAMRTFTRSSAPGEIAAYDFGRHGVIADVGGGSGAMVATILRACPHVRGILFDQPDVVVGSAEVLANAGVADRVEVVAGSFFEVVPGGADAYLLRRVLHDWPDRECGLILQQIRDVIPADGHLIVIDAVVGAPNEDPLVKFLDLMMLVSAGGKERTEPEWIDLLAAGGFRLEHIARGSANSHVLDASPA
ncbi:MAG: methyltransferase [Ilumatobacteraceae bacterium]